MEGHGLLCCLVVTTLVCGPALAHIVLKHQPVVHMAREGHGKGSYRLSFGNYKETFQVWKKQFAHVHGRNWNESERFEIFRDNVVKMERHNWLYHTSKSSFYMGLNQFSAMTNDEYQRYNRLGKYSKRRRSTRKGGPFSQFSCVGEAEEQRAGLRAVPDAVDWREKGYVTPVKDQGDCGSCWIFSAIGAIEGAYYSKHGRLISFSEQQVLDCCQLRDCGDCQQGGLQEAAYSYVHSAHGLDTETVYPYTASKQYCSFDSSSAIGNLYQCRSVSPQEDEDALKEACASNGPIAVSIDAHLDSFQAYEGGVYDDPRCNTDPDFLDHAVLVVGYAADSMGTEYWIVKNSWSTDWGLDGYINMIRNQGNACGIADDGTFPKMA